MQQQHVAVHQHAQHLQPVLTRASAGEPAYCTAHINPAWSWGNKMLSDAQSERLQHAISEYATELYLRLDSAMAAHASLLSTDIWQASGARPASLSIVECTPPSDASIGHTTNMASQSHARHHLSNRTQQVSTASAVEHVNQQQQQCTDGASTCAMRPEARKRRASNPAVHGNTAVKPKFRAGRVKQAKAASAQSFKQTTAQNACPLKQMNIDIADAWGGKRHQ